MFPNFTKILIIMFGMLLSVAACQKIDDAEVERLTKGDNSSADGKTDAEQNGDTPADINNSATLQVETEEHFVAVRKTLEDGVHMTLLSLMEWEDKPNGRSLDERLEDLRAVAEQYCEGGITGWHIPSRGEAEDIKALFLSSGAYSEVLNDANTKLKAMGGRPLNAWKGNDGRTPWRYFCEDAGVLKSFSFKAGSVFSNAGAQTTYYLRLVKDSLQTD